MPRWLRRSIGLITLGGSATGMSVILGAVFNSPGSTAVYILFAIFFTIYTVGLTAGMLILEKDYDARTLALPFWALQVPVIATPFVTYKMFSGLQMSVVLSNWEEFGFTWAAGASFDFYLFKNVPVSLGANVVAIVVCIALDRMRPPGDDATTDAEPAAAGQPGGTPHTGIPTPRVSLPENDADTRRNPEDA